MIHVLRGLKLKVAMAIISAILFYGALTFIASTPSQILAAEGLQRIPALRTTVTKTATATTPIPKLHAEVSETISAEAYERLVEREPASEYKAFVQNLLISVAIAFATMAVFRLRMR